MQGKHLKPSMGLTVTAVALATAGWVAFGFQVATSSRLSVERESLSRQSARWHLAAGKAYTAYLKESGGGQAGVLRVPAGATIGCSAKARLYVCDPNLIYPPEVPDASR